MPPREGPHYCFRGIEFWAEDGLITVVDVGRAEDSDVPHEDSVRHIRPGDLIKRAVAARIVLGDKYPNRAAEGRKLLEDAACAVKLTQKQGIPLTKASAEEALKKRRPTRLFIPGMPTPSPTFKLTDPREMLLDGVPET